MSDSLRGGDAPVSPFAGGGVTAIERLSPAQQDALFDEAFVDAEVLPAEEEEKEEGNDAMVQLDFGAVDAVDGDGGDSDDDYMMDWEGADSSDGSSSEGSESGTAAGGGGRGAVATGKPQRSRNDEPPWVLAKLFKYGMDQAAEDAAKAEFSEDGSAFTGGQSYVQKTGTRDSIKEWKCTYHRKLGCPFRLRIRRPGDEAGVVRIEKRMEHVHDFDAENSSAAVPLKVRIILDTMATEDRPRARKIWDKLAAGGVDIVEEFPASDKNKQAVMSRLRRLKKSAVDKEMVGTFGSLSKFLQDNTVPTDEIDTLEAHSFFCFEGSVVASEPRAACICFSTPHLLQNFDRGDRDLLQWDGTHRMNFQQMPFLVTGASDVRQKFHPGAFCLCFGESIEQISKFGMLTMQAAGAVTGTDVAGAREHTIQDNSDAFFGAGRLVLPNLGGGAMNCYAHMMTGLRKTYKSRFEDKEGYEGFRDDLAFIAGSTIKGGLHELLIEKLLAKHKSRGPKTATALETWEKEYTGDPKGNWAQSCSAPAVPTTNNGLEGYNNSLKEDGTLRLRLHVDEFLDNIKKFVELESKTNQGQGFAVTVELKLDDWRKAQILSASPLYFGSVVTHSGFTFLPSSVFFKEITKGRGGGGRGVKKKIANGLKPYAQIALKPEPRPFSENTKAKQFDEIRTILSKAYHLAPITGRAKAKFGGVGYQCSCTHFWHYGKCKHALGYAIYKKEIAIPPIYNISNIGTERTRGRPKEARGGGALAKDG